MSSAATDGVGARRSATKSVMAMSISWPMAETMGICEAATARATDSKLKVQRSSSEPPPRVSKMASTVSLLAAFNARKTPASASGPCTAVGMTVTCSVGKRRCQTARTSCNAAPVGDVTTAICLGISGIGRLRSRANSPSSASLTFNASNACRSTPSPAGSI